MNNASFSLSILCTTADMYKFGNGGWNVSKVQDLSYMYFQNKGFNNWIGGWNTLKVRDMSSMLRGASLYSKEISGFKLANCTDTSRMFELAKKFNFAMAGWEVTNVKHLDSMFANSSLNQNLCQWGSRLYGGISKALDVEGMFANTSCSFKDDPNLAQLPVKPLCFSC